MAHLILDRNGRIVAKAGLPPHGTRARYVSRIDPCRCGECRRANAAYIAEYRQRQRRR
jgi:hypothetical protein